MTKIITLPNFKFIFSVFQLKHFDALHLSKNIRNALPSDWIATPTNKIIQWNPNSSDEPPEKWNETLWRYLNKHFSNNLQNFENLPIVPIGGNQLGFLTKGKLLGVLKVDIFNPG